MTDNSLAALEYAARHWRVFPLPPRSKIPRIQQWQKKATDDAGLVRAWFEQEPASNIAIATGAGLLVVDLDGADGLATWNALQSENGESETLMARTGGGGIHLFFHTSGETRNTARLLGPGVDTRGDGGFIVAPPSIHPSGNAYLWINPEEEPAEAPQWLVSRLDEQRRAPAEQIGDTIPEGQREDELVSLAGSMRRRGMSAIEISAALTAVNDLRCLPPLPPESVSRIATSVSRYKPAEDRNGTGPITRVTVRLAADYGRRAVQWLPGYEGFIPISMISLVAGLQGFGKSLLTCLVAAAETQSGRRVCLAAAEDSIEHTVRPRLEAAGADLNLVSIVGLEERGEESLLHLPEHHNLLREAMVETRPSVLLIDPISAYLGKSIDSWKDTDVRLALTPLKYLAEELTCAICLIAHLSKGSQGSMTDFLNRVSGSMAFTAAVRSAMLFGADPNDPEGERGSQRVLIAPKSNLAARNQKGRAYRIQTTHLSAIPEYGMEAVTAPFLVYAGETEVSDRQVLAGGSDAVREAADVLKALLEDGEPHDVKEIKPVLNDHDITKRISEGARKRLGVIIRRHGQIPNQRTTWELPS